MEAFPKDTFYTLQFTTRYILHFTIYIKTWSTTNATIRRMRGMGAPAMAGPGKRVRGLGLYDGTWAWD